MEERENKKINIAILFFQAATNTNQPTMILLHRRNKRRLYYEVEY